jgi:signal transduction histidine kinase
MNIKTKLSLQFTILVTSILIFFSALVYYFSYSTQLSKFRENLFDKARNTAILLINVTEVDSSLLKKIHQSTVSWKREEIALTDSALNIVYSNNLQYLPGKIMQLNYGEGINSFFSIGEKDGIRYKHKFKNRSFNVFVMAFDNNRLENLAELRGILIWSILFSIGLSIFLSYIFSKNAIRPISNIVRNVKAINNSSLANRLSEGNRKDEIEQLAITFNEMLANLEDVFKSQEDFVSNASHELRTPISIMIVEADYLLSHPRKQEEYFNHISRLIADLKDLNALLNSLLELAQINQSTNIQLSPVRMDEVIFTAMHQVKTKYPNRRIIPKIEYPENGNDLLIDGNSGLLTIVITNLLENSCKFSDEDVLIELLIIDSLIKITISDKGIGIPQDEMESIFKPFKRASNAKFKGGFGIGLSLVAKIIDHHKAEIKVLSTENEGTSFEMSFLKTQA